MSDILISLGHAVSDAIWRLSFASRFFLMTIEDGRPFRPTY
jgi:hypothetical protein